ncbi:MAG: nucleotidyltransferase [Verrucomicrobia bacterium]|nr:nucleotidyltransferase [Verrucomicrobiota bacterium]MDA1086826.1 nucleotidyltransferase [Verrucomicrobiota bacterium]
MKTALETVCDALNAKGTQFLLIGGFALPVYGVVRQTADVDYLVSDADDLVLGEILAAAGYSEKHRAAAFVRYEHPSVYLMDIDIMLVDTDTFTKMHGASAVHMIGTSRAYVPTLLHLVALKLHAIRNNPKRELKDLGDIVELLRENPSTVSTRDLAQTCQEYGPPGIFEKLESYL